MSNLLPYAFARDFAVLAQPSDSAENTVDILVSSATNPAAIAEVSRRFGRIQLKTMPRGDLEAAIAAAYASAGGNASMVADEFDANLDLTKLLQDVPAIEDLLESSDDAPVIRMINALLTQALRDSASDIHIEPFEQTSVVRFRIGGSPVDVRVSTLPTGHGERAVLRLLDKEAGRLDLQHLGMSEQMLPQFDTLINQPHGIVLVTGPTGSGKTTTLYAALSLLNATTTNILTVEDPIEYDLAGVGQTQVNSRIDMTFAKALRAILRQDPDVIMICEIRDLETAQIAVQASLTGHLVLATLHTNDAAAAVTRLLDMGIEPFLLSSSLLGVLAQRLVRKLCGHCKRYDGSLWHAVGCEHCGQTGYQGRVGVYELLTTTEQIRAQIHNRASEADVKAAALKSGMVTMREDGERWLRNGTTTQAELLRVTKED